MKITAQQLRRLIREEVEAISLNSGEDHDRFLHGFESGHPVDDEGYMTKSRLYSMKKMAHEICDLLETGDQLPAWVQDHIAVSHENLQQVHGYLTGDEALRNYSDDMHGMENLDEKKSKEAKDKEDADGDGEVTAADVRYSQRRAGGQSHEKAFAATRKLANVKI